LLSWPSFLELLQAEVGFHRPNALLGGPNNGNKALNEKQGTDSYQGQSSGCHHHFLIHQLMKEERKNHLEMAVTSDLCQLNKGRK